MNAGWLKQGLLSDSTHKPQTGTATGDRAAADFAKQTQFANAANMDRGMAKANAQTYGQRQQQSEQMGQQWRQAQMQRFRSLSNQKSQQSAFAMKLLESQIGMQSDWQNSLIGMISQ